MQCLRYGRSGGNWAVWCCAERWEQLLRRGIALRIGLRPSWPGKREALENLKALAMFAREVYAQVRSVDRHSGSAARLRGFAEMLGGRLNERNSRAASERSERS